MCVIKDFLRWAAVIYFRIELNVGEKKKGKRNFLFEEFAMAFTCDQHQRHVAIKLYENH